MSAQSGPPTDKNPKIHSSIFTSHNSTSAGPPAVLLKSHNNAERTLKSWISESVFCVYSPSVAYFVFARMAPKGALHFCQDIYRHLLSSVSFLTCSPLSLSLLKITNRQISALTYINIGKHVTSFLWLATLTIHLQ